MSVSRDDRLASTDPRYGTVCPDCAAPKSKQARSCQACYRDRILTGKGGPQFQRGAASLHWRGGYQAVPSGTGSSRGRPQPRSHPWRRKNDQLFRVRAA